MVRAAIIGASLWQPSSPACAWAPASPPPPLPAFAEPDGRDVPLANAALLRRTPERKVLVGTAIVTCGMLLRFRAPTSLA